MPKQTKKFIFSREFLILSTHSLIIFKILRYIQNYLTKSQKTFNLLKDLLKEGIIKK